jgi:predicted NAD/FAD-dependent oxidoreductase
MLKSTGLVVRVVEKSRGAGGRMATHRFREGDRASPVLARADLGAQYVSTKSSPDHVVLGPVYSRLQKENILIPFSGTVTGPNPYGGSDDVRHYTAPHGLQSIADHFLESDKVSVDWGSAVEEILLDENGNADIKVTGGNSIELASPCVVVLTQPVPQILGKSKFPLKGNFLERVDQNLADNLKKVEYSSRFAAAYYFENVSWPFDWTVQYFSEGDVRYVSHDTGKRGAADERLTSVVVHSAVPLGIELGDEEEPFPRAAERLQTDLKRKLPEMPWDEARFCKLQKWKYSQVYKGFAGKRPAPDWTWLSGEACSKTDEFPGCIPLFQTDQVLGLTCGDAFAPASKFDGCVFSAHRAAEAVGAFFQVTPTTQ